MAEGAGFTVLAAFSGVARFPINSFQFFRGSDFCPALPLLQLRKRLTSAAYKVSAQNMRFRARIDIYFTSSQTCQMCARQVTCWIMTFRFSERCHPDRRRFSAGGRACLEQASPSERAEWDLRGRHRCRFGFRSPSTLGSRQRRWLRPNEALRKDIAERRKCRCSPSAGALPASHNVHTEYPASRAGVPVRKQLAPEFQLLRQ